MSAAVAESDDDDDDDDDDENADGLQETSRAMSKAKKQRLVRAAHPAFPALLEEEEATVTTLEVEDGDATSSTTQLPFYKSLSFAYAGPTLIEFTGTRALDPVREFLLPTLDALAFLHARGVIHCDVNPFNACVSPGNAIKLIDFGSSAIVTSERRWRQRGSYLLDDATSLPSTQRTPPIPAKEDDHDEDRRDKKRQREQKEGKEKEETRPTKKRRERRETTKAGGHRRVEKCILGRLCNLPEYREPLANALLVPAKTTTPLESPPLTGLRVDGSSDAFAAAMCCADLCRAQWPRWRVCSCLRDEAAADAADEPAKMKALFAACRRNPAHEAREFAEANHWMATLRRDLAAAAAAAAATAAANGGSGDDDREADKRPEKKERPTEDDERADANEGARAQREALAAREFATALDAIGYAAHAEHTDYPGLLSDVKEIYGRSTVLLLRRCLRPDRARRTRWWEKRTTGGTFQFHVDGARSRDEREDRRDGEKKRREEKDRPDHGEEEEETHRDAMRGVSSPRVFSFSSSSSCPSSPSLFCSSSCSGSCCSRSSASPSSSPSSSSSFSSSSSSSSSSPFSSCASTLTASSSSPLSLSRFPSCLSLALDSLWSPLITTRIATAEGHGSDDAAPCEPSKDALRKIDVMLGRCWLATGAVKPNGGKLFWWCAAEYVADVGAAHAASVLSAFVDEARRVDFSLQSSTPETWPVEDERQARSWRATLAVHRAALSRSAPISPPLPPLPPLPPTPSLPRALRNDDAPPPTSTNALDHLSPSLPLPSAPPSGVDLDLPVSLAPSSPTLARPRRLLSLFRRRRRLRRPRCGDGDGDQTSPSSPAPTATGH